MNALKGTLIKVGGFQHLDCCCCVAKRAHGVIGIDAQITVDRSLDRELGVGGLELGVGDRGLGVGSWRGARLRSRSISSGSVANDSILRFQDRKPARR